MSGVADAEGRNDNDGHRVNFVYTGQDASDVPRDVTHVLALPSARVIARGAFFRCRQLVEVRLCEGLMYIRAHAFVDCLRLRRIVIPSTVREIGERAFFRCWKLVEVELCEGLDRIESQAFAVCRSLRRIQIPLTVKSIGNGAFSACQNLVEVELCEGLTQICLDAFSGCRELERIRIPPSVSAISVGAFRDCQQLVTIELCEGIQGIESAFQTCHSLRNLMIPETTMSSNWSNCFEGCHDLMRALGAQMKCIDQVLRHRFDDLPTHQICYCQATLSTEETLALLEGTKIPLSDGKEFSSTDQDCFGMTPLHILACSTKHSLEVYQRIIDFHPNSIITEDKWGCLPIFYAIWGNAPQIIVQFLTANHRSAFPNVRLHWDGMVETLCRAGTSPHKIDMLLNIKETKFSESEDTIDWRKAAREFTICCLVRCGGLDDLFDSASIWWKMMECLHASQAHLGQLIHNLVELQHIFFPNRIDANWKVLSEYLVAPLRGWWKDGFPRLSLLTFHFLVRCNIPTRLGSLGVRGWRLYIENMIKMIRSMSFTPLFQYDAIHKVLIFYEHEYHQLKEAAFLLELALWKSNILGQSDNPLITKWQHRVNCGANEIIPNVLSYLIVNEINNLGV
jgi:hypothetical protein